MFLILGASSYVGRHLFHAFGTSQAIGTHYINPAPGTVFFDAVGGEISDILSGTTGISHAFIVELTISAGHERKRYLSKFIDKTAVALKLKAENNPDAVPKLQVGILPNLDSAVETVDLIAQRLSLTFEKIEVGEDLRFPRKARYKALRRAFNGWKKLF